ncbi:MAG TPA: YeeE/YedE family protein [Burkholderiales bacterium]|nr:YeeE/YedE family protein [Burkholderiales bacterium]
MENFTPVSALAGGVLIGLASVWLLAANGRIAGVSGILHGLVGGMSASPPGDRPWRAAFIAGLIVAGFGWQLLGGSAPGPSTSWGWLALAGALVGFGTRIGGGCTSGHGVCGLGRFSLRSLVAVMVFMATGMVATFVMRHVL